MKAVTPNLLDADSSFASNSKSINYDNYSSGKFGSQILPVEHNFLRYIDKNKNDKFTKAIYRDPDTKSPSSEFRMNLIYYYVFIIIYILILVSFSILLYSNNDMPGYHLKIHLICLGVLAAFSIGILISLFKYEFILLQSRNIFLALSCSICFYLIFTDERILHKFTNEPLSNNIQPLSLGLICMIVMTRLILFDYFLYTCILGMSTSLIFLTTHLALQELSIYVILSEISIVLLFIFIQIIECYREDIRIKHLF